MAQGWVRGLVKKVKWGKCGEKGEEWSVKIWEKKNEKKKKGWGERKVSCGLVESESERSEKESLKRQKKDLSGWFVSG